MTRARAVVAAVAVAGLALGVTSCEEDDPEPRRAPASPATSDATPSAGTSAAGGSAQEAFVRDYFGLLGTATRTGDTSGFMAVTSPSCVNCNTLARNIEAAYIGASRVEGASWEVTDLSEVGEAATGDEWEVDVSTARERWYDESGELIRIVKASTQHFGLVVAKQGDSFTVVDLRLRS